MAAAWMLTEFQLKQMIYDWKTAQSGGSYYAHLFQNDYVPVDATVLGDLEEADFDGYAAVFFDPVDFADPTWTPYVAQILLTVFLTFTADSGLAEPQTVYGYYVQNGDDELVWAERWEVPFEFDASSVLNMKPALRQKTCRES